MLLFFTRELISIFTHQPMNKSLISQKTDSVPVLLQHAQQGDGSAFAGLYDRFAPAVLGVIAGILPDKPAAEEVLQETFLRIRQGIAGYDAKKERLLLWMLGIARRLALEAAQTFSAKPAVQIQDRTSFVNEFVHPGKNPVASFTSENGREGKRALDLIFLEGYSFAQAAEKLGLDPGKLRAELHRNLKNLSETHQ